MKRCTYCGKEYDDTATVCVIDREPLIQVVITPPDNQPEPSVEFMRLFFTSPDEEEFAVRSARCIAQVVGERVTLLRPNTTWSEILEWFGQSDVRKVMLAVELSKDLGKEFKAALACPELVTFRDFVEDACRNKRSRSGHFDQPA